MWLVVSSRLMPGPMLRLSGRVLVAPQSSPTLDMSMLVPALMIYLDILHI